MLRIHRALIDVLCYPIMMNRSVHVATCLRLLKQALLMKEHLPGLFTRLLSGLHIIGQPGMFELLP